MLAACVGEIAKRKRFFCSRALSLSVPGCGNDAGSVTVLLHINLTETSSRIFLIAFFLGHIALDGPRDDALLIRLAFYEHVRPLISPPRSIYLSLSPSRHLQLVRWQLTPACSACWTSVRILLLTIHSLGGQRSVSSHLRTYNRALKLVSS